jgi:hypothetical protein
MLHDAETFFAAAGNVPRLVMNRLVSSIKAGDTVRVVYPNGDVYDFEAEVTCSPVAICPMDNPVKKESPSAPAKPSSLEIRKLRDDTCPWDSGYTTVGTGYWSDSVVETGENHLTHTLKWVDTGDVDVYIKGGGCK